LEHDFSVTFREALNSEIHPKPGPFGLPFPVGLPYPVATFVPTAKLLQVLSKTQALEAVNLVNLGKMAKIVIFQPASTAL